MNARLLPSTLIVVLLLAFGAVVAACGGGGGEPLTLEEYFQRLEELSNELDQGADALEPAVEGSPDDQVEVFQEALNGFLPLLVDYVGGIKEMNPPEELKEPYSGFVARSDDVLEAVENLIDELENVESEAELNEVIAGFESSAPLAPAGQACLALQRVFDERELDVDLRCEG